LKSKLLVLHVDFFLESLLNAYNQAFNISTLVQLLYHAQLCK